ncbi:MAG: tetratricopeptide repeat protein, partial [Acidobacteriota bacterium]
RPSTGAPRSFHRALRAGYEMDNFGGGAPNAGYLVPHEFGTYAVVASDGSVVASDGSVVASDGSGVASDGSGVAAGGEFVPTSYVFKQYLHLRLFESFPDLPYWFRQGIAEYFSSFRTEGDLALIGLASDAQKHWIRRGPAQLLSPSRMMEIDDDAVARGVERTFFLQSWATVHYLINRDGADMAEVARFVAATEQGVPPVQAFQETYGVELASLTEAVDAYLRRGQLRYLKMPVKKLSLLSMKFKSLSPADAACHLGDLLARAVPDRAAQAASHYEHALALDSDHGPSWAGLGDLAAKAGDFETARRHFAKAASLEPEDFVIQYLHGSSRLGVLGGQRPADEVGEKALRDSIAALTASVELRESFGAAWAELAYAHGLAPEATDAGVAAIRRALDFFPERTDLALNLLLAHARRGEREGADAVWGGLVAARAEPATLDRAREILLQMDYREAVRLVRGGEGEEAVALFGRVQTETRDAGLRQLVEEQLKKLSIAGDYAAFFELYNEAADAINAGERGRATSLIESMATRFDQSWQQSQIRRLRIYLAKR